MISERCYLFSCGFHCFIIHIFLSGGILWWSTLSWLIVLIHLPVLKGLCNIFQNIILFYLQISFLITVCACQSLSDYGNMLEHYDYFRANSRKRNKVQEWPVNISVSQLQAYLAQRVGKCWYITGLVQNYYKSDVTDINSTWCPCFEVMLQFCANSDMLR